MFGADEVLHVLSGTMVLANPETGETQRVPAGGACSSGRTRGITPSRRATSSLQVLEFLAPPPASGSTGAYARTCPYLEHAVYEREPGSNAPDTLRPIRDEEIVWHRDLGVRAGRSRRRRSSPSGGSRSIRARRPRRTRTRATSCSTSSLGRSGFGRASRTRPTFSSWARRTPACFRPGASTSTATTAP